MVVVGSGPIRIGQGIEFDYSCVHAAWALRAAGRSAVIVNNNPETVSTDFDISDVLVFEPPGADEVEAAYRATHASGVMLAFGGQTAINLAPELEARGVRIIGSDRAQPRHGRGSREVRCGALALGRGAPAKAKPPRVSAKRASSRANWDSRCSCGRRTCWAGAAWRSFITKASSRRMSSPRRRFRPARRCWSISICVGSRSRSTRSSTARTFSFPGIFEHIERAGIHSGDSISVYPTQTVDAAMEGRIVDVTTAIARELGIRGLINIQFVVHEGDLYIIEANPRASRTVPIIRRRPA